MTSFFRYLRTLVHVDDYQKEALARVAVASAISYSLALADIPHLVPRNFAFLTGMVGVLVTLSLPKMLFSIALAIPMFLSLIIFVVIATTAILAAATVSNGCLVAVFAIITFLVQSLYLSKYRTLARLMVGFIMALVALLSLSYLSLVQDGLDIPIFTVAAETFGSLTETLQQQFCLESDWFPLNQCTPDNISNALAHLDLSNANDWQVDIPVGVAAGETVTFYVGFENGNPEIFGHIPGGIWLVKALWTEKGTENSLAFFRNFVTAVCWSVAVVVFSILIPPVRTLRSFLSRTAVPGILRALSGLLKAMGNDEIGHQMTVEQERKREVQLIAMYNQINVASAKMLRYEPPFFSASPFLDLVPYMANLLESVQHALMACLSVTALLEDSVAAGGEDDAVVSAADWNERADFVQKIAIALQLNDVALINQIQPPATQSSEEDSNQMIIRSILDKRFAALLDAAKEWIHATNKTTTKQLSIQEKVAFVMRSIWYSFHTSLIPLLILLNDSKLPRQPIRMLLWCTKWTLGMVGLVCMGVYWEKFANFAIHVTDVPIGAIFRGYQIMG